MSDETSFSRETATQTADMPHGFVRNTIQRTEACRVCGGMADDARHSRYDSVAEQASARSDFQREVGS